MTQLEFLKDDWFTVQQIDHSTYAISEYGHWEKVHSFLLIGEHNAALIDTGNGIDNIKRVVDQLTDLPIIVITSHVHWDHIGSHGQFDEIYVHEAEMNWLLEGMPGLPLSQIRKDIGRDITKPTPETFDAATFVPYRGNPEHIHTLKDGDVIDLGERELIIYHTPGHSPGHINIYDKHTQYLFTGDLLYVGTPIYAFYPTTDPKRLVDSLEKICSISEQVSIVFGSHNEVGIDVSIFDDVREAIRDLRKREVVQQRTGLHHYGRISFQF
jgi:glyoxylase-like metal-dependent hydrolase (beta-lactamase superfamily II)